MDQPRSEDSAKMDDNLTFISIVSHQLKGLISKVRWSSEILLGGDVGELRADQRELIDQIHEAGMHMNETIALAVSLTKVQAGEEKLELERADLRALTLEVVRELDTDIREKHLTVVVTPEASPFEAFCDTRLVKQAIFHFLSNAIRYSNPGGAIEIDIARDAQRITVSVRDHGIGMPQDEQGNIFNRFFRATNAKEKTPEGFGLGLFFTKHIVALWGGEVGFESEEGKGSVFHFTIPIK